ncbi:HigA family addiction module antitoxin [uncultured Sphingomonas sp.]|uniref:HigA family addiction module antitoxin n=1 Tax=uncultured Sphingomonas sp. TaxID=158754 RepID=UPI0035CAD9F5
MSRLPTITDPDLLHNAHAGELLWREFMEPLGLSAEDVARAVRLPSDRIDSVVQGRRRVDGELDLRLARYFRMSEGFFLRLQDSYELLEARRALSGELDRIVPRAA